LERGQRWWCTVQGGQGQGSLKCGAGARGSHFDEVRHKVLQVERSSSDVTVACSRVT
jgi:hypothetical protein